MKDNEGVARMEDTEDTEVVCPYCGSRNIANIMYGMPVFDAELRRELDEGTVALGGCVIEIDRPCRLITATIAVKSSNVYGRHRLLDRLPFSTVPSRCMHVRSRTLRPARVN